MPKAKSELSDLRALLRRLEKADGLDSTSVAEWRRRRESAECRIKELELAEREGKLLDAEEVRQAVEGLILHAREQFMGIASALQDKLAGMSDPVACGKLIEAEIRRALTALSEYPPKKTKAVRRSKSLRKEQ